MGKVKVRVLYPAAFLAQGVDTKGADDVEVEESLAADLVKAGWAELIKPEPEPEPEAPKRAYRKASK